jgi:hypothetical protein
MLTGLCYNNNVERERKIPNTRKDTKMAKKITKKMVRNYMDMLAYACNEIMKCKTISEMYDRKEELYEEMDEIGSEINWNWDKIDMYIPDRVDSALTIAIEALEEDGEIPYDDEDDE